MRRLPFACAVVPLVVSNGPSLAFTDRTPASYLRSAGAMGDSILPLLLGLLAVAVAVVVIVSVLVVVGILRSRQRSAVPIDQIPLSETHATEWISIGVGVSTIVLIGLVVWTSITMAHIANPPTEPALTIEVRGHQWWWEAVYLNENPSQIFKTANEIHIPVGRPVRFALKGTDVIHSFWVPALGGKTDAIPGQTNLTWLQADRPGVYRGQCSEYCGQQHAHMDFVVMADAPDSFENWRQAQVQAAPTAQNAGIREGEQNFVQHCGVCHAVRGTRAGGAMGPDLTHLMSRTSLAAGLLPNNPGYLSGWIANPQRLKPGSMMPDLDISGPDLASIRSFLVKLK
jgi:cytochrome c oxidase subunit 2